MREEIIGDCRLILGDCRDVLPTLGRVDAVVTDPPYSEGTHQGARGKGATTGGQHVLVDFESFDAARWTEMVADLVAISERWVLVFCDWTLAQNAGSLPLVRMGVWTKNDPAPQFTGDRPATGWENIAIFHKPGRKRWNGGGRPAVWRTNIEKAGEHPTQKPLSLMMALVRDFTEYRETVLDPFMGSGTTGVACVKLGRKFIGIERETKYFDIALRRIEEAYKQPDLFVSAPAPKAEQFSLLEAAE